MSGHIFPHYKHIIDGLPTPGSFSIWTYSQMSFRWMNTEDDDAIEELCKDFFVPDVSNNCNQHANRHKVEGIIVISNTVIPFQICSTQAPPEYQRSQLTTISWLNNFENYSISIFGHSGLSRSWKASPPSFCQQFLLKLIFAGGHILQMSNMTVIVCHYLNVILCSAMAGSGGGIMGSKK